MKEPSIQKVTTPSPDQGLENCPIRNVICRFGDSWSFVTLLTLSEEKKRFNELQRSLPKISQRVLTQTLRQLERDGFISRTVVATVPIRVTYALTQLGISFIEPATSLLRWAEAANPAINVARQCYDIASANPEYPTKA